MRVRFWGTRGSIAKSGPDVLRYGGNTSCVEVRTDAGTLLVLDCGTGAHDPGLELAAPDRAGRSGHLLISHTHWDHIQGLPSFVPLFSPGSRRDIYAPRGIGRSLRETLAGQMQSPYFPFALEELGADIRFHELVEGTLRIDDVHLHALPRPLRVHARLRADGATLVYACDHEPHARDLAGGRGRAGGRDLRHAAFPRGAQFVIHDARFTPEEYRGRTGWGHGTGEYAALMCRMAGVRTLALSHHDPGRRDGEVDRIVLAVRASLDAAAGPLDVVAAAGGQVFTPAGSGGPPPPEPDAPSADEEPAALLRRSVVIGAAGAALADLLSGAVRSDGFRVVLGRSARGAVEAVEVDRPFLVLIEHGPGAIDGVAACRDIRRLAIAGAEELPVVVVSAREDEAGGEGDAEAGVTERIEAPFSAAYLRARVRAWMLRRACRWRRAELPADEERRLAALGGSGVLDTPPEERFDRLTRLAAALFEVSVAFITLVDRDRQWFKSRHGLDVLQTPRDTSFCAHAPLRDDVAVVPDTRHDGRFADNPFVAGGARVRFYAGCPIRDPGGACSGTLCLTDTRPRDLEGAKLGLLRDLGGLVRQELFSR